ncbi:unnamed protein product [Toxocara canis]|uniref:Uncharacterized protein n=1 Tax=Toxocara canis TaxID=6265 RepID=A0A183U5S0_TOXCA|nr:unnamed protein product [Toxocara canis]
MHVGSWAGKSRVLDRSVGVCIAQRIWKCEKDDCSSLRRPTNEATNTVASWKTESELSQKCGAIRQVTPKDFTSVTKLNSVEFQNDGLNSADAAAISNGFQKLGIHFVKFCGGYERFEWRHLL